MSLTFFSNGSLIFEAELLFFDEDESEPWDKPTWDLSRVVSDPDWSFQTQPLFELLVYPACLMTQLSFQSARSFDRRLSYHWLKKHLSGKLLLGQTIEHKSHRRPRRSAQELPKSVSSYPLIAPFGLLIVADLALIWINDDKEWTLQLYDIQPAI